MGMSIRQMFNIASTRMVRLGALYPIRTAARVVRATRPELRGPAYWRAVRQALRLSGRAGPPPLVDLAFLGAVKSVETAADGAVLVRSAEGTLRVRALATDVIQLRYRPDDDFKPPFSYSVAKPEEEWAETPVEVVESDTHVQIATADMRLSIDRATGELSLFTADGTGLFAGGRGAVAHEGGEAAGWQAQFEPGTPFYGMGEKAFGLNYAGRQLELWNVDPSGYGRGKDPLYMSVPFTMALAGGQAVGIYVDNTYRAWADFGTESAGRFDYRTAGGEMRLYVMAGTPARVLEQYTALTGRLSLPPLWAFGLHQSRWSYFPQPRVLQIADEYRSRSLPCDVIHIDIHYMDDYRSFTWDRARFPELDRMTARLHEQGFKALTMIDPGIKVDPGYHVYDQGVANGYFVKYPDGVRFTGPVWPGNCHFPDFSSPAVREWWGGLYRELLDQGVDAFWNDMNEPAIITGSPATGEVPGILMHDREGQGSTHAELHNVYGLLMVRASVEGLQRLRPDRRPLILSRSGWAGLQRYALHWTGDNRSTWDDLALSIPMVINLGISGIPVTGPDAGGFTGGPSPELFARWMQVGAFTPFFRIHSMVGSADQEPWAFGAEVEAISRRYLELRYRLLPAIYTAAWQAAQTGLPIMRALAFDYPADERTHSLDDQFLFGDAFLVAPVLAPGQHERDVYLPAGEWYDFWTGQRHQGGQTVTVEAPLDVLPLFVRGGAAVPLWPVHQYAGELPVEELELRVYRAAGEHTSLLYEDDGETVHYEEPGEHRVSRFVVVGAEDGSTRVTREVVRGHYAPPYETVRVVVYGLDGPPGEVACEGGTLLEQAWDEETRTFSVRVRSEGGFVLQIM